MKLYIPEINDLLRLLYKMMNEYAILKAKHYVEEALNTVSENYAQGSLTPLKGVSVKESILTAYPLTNIK